MAKAEASKVAGVLVTHPDKVMFGIPTVTKLELAEYYKWISTRMLKEVKARPLMLLRCPAGNKQRGFYQKHFEGKTPFPTVKIKEEDGGSPENYAYVNSVSDLVKLVQLNTVEFHVWGSRVTDVEKPDRIVFDLDPGNPRDHDLVIEVAFLLKRLLSKLKLKSFARISGGKGIHVVVPISPKYSWEKVKEFSEAVALLLVDQHASVTVNPLKVKRKNKIFVDYLRNGRGATAITNYSVRARKGGPIAVPISWRELRKVPAFNYITISNVRAKLKGKVDPWSGMYKLHQKLPTLSEGKN